MATPDARFEALLRDYHHLYETIDEILREAESSSEMPDDEAQRLNEVHRRVGKAVCDWLEEAGERVRAWPA